MIGEFHLDRLIEQYRDSSDKQEMIDLAYQMEEILFDSASFIPGFVQPHFRRAHWRWVKYPEGYAHKHSRNNIDLFLSWVDEEAKSETRAAMNKNVRLPKSVRVYSQYQGQ